MSRGEGGGVAELAQRMSSWADEDTLCVNVCVSSV